MKKLLIALALITATLGNVAYAAQTGWYVVKVALVGKQGDGIYMRADHVHAEPKFTNVLFKLDPSIQLEGLAISMAAVSTNKLLSIESDVENSEPGIAPRVISIYLYNQQATSRESSQGLN